MKHEVKPEKCMYEDGFYKEESDEVKFKKGAIKKEVSSQ